MKKLEIITRPDKIEEINDILLKSASGGITVFNVMGCGNQKGGITLSYNNTDLNINLLPKIQINAIIEDAILDEVLGQIKEKLSTGVVGDGKVFVFDVYDVMRIRTGERGEKAI